ncbi:MAG: GntR family transcriptional regulator [Planctomycetota bacterium]|nr:GntR family transcriptional regulator [Planctomycetota bacterium]
MEATDSPEIPQVGRAGAELTSLLIKRMGSGQYPAGQYLPTSRELSERHQVARKTVQHALKKLEAEGFVAAEPRKGYRVLARASDPDKGCPLVYIADLRATPDLWKPLNQELLSALQGAAARRGWTLMGVGSQGRTDAAVLKQLVASRTSGLIVDSVHGEMMETLRECGLPAVAVDAWEAGAPIDLVVQDSYQGGQFAAEYLFGKGHQALAWVGPTTWSAHSLARLSGMIAGCLKAGRPLPQERIFECPARENRAQIEALLKRPDRPRAIVALFVEVAATIVEVGRELSLLPGRDYDLVGWCTEQQYRRDWVPLFRGAPAAACVVWSPIRMAELAIDRFETRRRHPHLTPIRISVPVEVRGEGWRPDTRLGT